MDLQPEVTQQPDIHRGPRVTMQNVELMKAQVSYHVQNMYYFPTFAFFTNPYILQLTQKLHQLERDISRVTLDDEGCAQLNQLINKHKLDEINQRVELASDPSRADPRQTGKNSTLFELFRPK